MSNKEEFLTAQSQGYRFSAEWVVNRIATTGKSIEQTIDMTDEELVELIIEMQPINLKMITGFFSIIGLYAKWSGNDAAYQRIQRFDRKAIWKRYQDTHEIKQRFISHEDFNDLLYNIEIMEEYNADYYVALLRSIYEGIYSDDMSVLKNLRGSDIHDNLVTLNEDNGHSFELEITFELAGLLKDMADVNVWQRANRCGICNIKIEGNYPDSCFKNENRHDTKDGNYKFSYYTRIRKISSDYLDFNLKPKNLYVSGLMWRIQQRLEEHGMSFEQAFRNNHKQGADLDIIQNELNRCCYPYDLKYLKQMVLGHLDTFVENKNSQ